MKTRKIVSKYLIFLGVLLVLGLVGNNTKAKYKKGDCRDCLIVDNFQDFHGKESWHVCQRDLPKCWKFKDEGFRDAFLKSYDSANEGTAFHPSFFQDYNLFSKQDIHGNQFVYNESGELAYTSQYGKGFKKNKTMTAELGKRKSCGDDPIYDKATNMKVTYFGEVYKRPVNFKSAGLVGADVFGKRYEIGSGLVTGNNCDVLITAAHNVKTSKNQVKARKMSNYHFTQNNSSDASREKTKSKGFVEIYTGFDGKTTSDNKNIKSNDWAVVRLKEPATEGCIKDLEINFEGREKECVGNRVLIGYEKLDTKQKYEFYNCFRKSKKEVFFEENIRTIDDDNVFGHRCDTIGKISGAPIMCKYFDESGEVKYRLDGIHVQGAPGSDGKLAHWLPESSSYSNLGIFIHGEFSKRLSMFLEN